MAHIKNRWVRHAEDGIFEAILTAIAMTVLIVLSAIGLMLW